MFLFIAVAAGVMLISGMSGAMLASRRGQNPWVWLAFCVAAPIVGQIVMLLLPYERETAPQRRKAKPARIDHAPPITAPVQPPAAIPLSMPQTASSPIAALAANPLAGLPPVSHEERWCYVIEYDPLLRDAARLLAPLGPSAIEELRNAHFALQDRSLVAGIVSRIRQRFEEQAVTRRLVPLPEPTGHQAPDLRRQDRRAEIDAAGAALVQPFAALERFATGEAATIDSVAAAKSSAPAANGAISIPSHTTVTTGDLDTANYVETYRGVHLYRLADGRVYVDGELALASVEVAHRMIDAGQLTTPA